MNGVVFNSSNNSTEQLADPWEVSKNMIELESQGDTIPINTAPQNEIKIETGDSVDFVLTYVNNEKCPNAHVRREEFERGLVQQGLQLDLEKHGNLCFVKIHAPIEVLFRFSEIMKVRMPIKRQLCDVPIGEEEEDDDLLDDAKSWVARIFKCVQLDRRQFPTKECKLIADFARDRAYLFDLEDEHFFDANVRAMIVDFILERQSEGIQRLLVDGVYSAAYPLHDGSWKEPGSTRALLYEEWGKTNKWLKLQPLDAIQQYFGVNFAIYFGWLGFYTYMLIPASIAGLVVFFYGWLNMSGDTLAHDACGAWAQNVTMCPQCDKTCDYWQLSDTCWLTKVTFLFDNPMTVPYAVFMSIWSVLYLELWRRRSMELSYRWGLSNWDRCAEHPRPNYLASLNRFKIFKIKEKINFVTNEKEPHVSYWKIRMPARFLSFSVVALMTFGALGIVFGIVVYRMSIVTSNTLFGQEIHPKSYTNFAIPATIAASINLVCILLLNYVYDYIAHRLTEMELPRTQSEFDDSLTLKVYIFQFVNYYSCIFYIAFLKGKFVGYPKKYNRVFGYRQEECSPGGCFMELCIQLAIIMVGKQALYTAMEMVWPILFKWWALIRAHTGLKRRDPIAPHNQWIRDLKLLDWGPRGLYDEYLEMVIQFGFITLFVVAFPLAPLFALANNVLEMRLDATKFLRHYRRPVPRRARDIGVWSRILETIARISVTSNAFIIAFSSQMIPRLVYMASVSRDKSDRGFLNHSLAYFNTVDFANGTAPIYSAFENVTTCRYAEYRNPPDHPDLPYKRPGIYWHILAARLAFVVIFQNLVGLFTLLIQWLLSGMPTNLRNRMKKEAYLIEEMVIKHESSRAREERARTEQVVDYLRKRKTASSSA